jgi:hypothetical protein
MKVYYLEDGSAGRLRTIWFHESETSRQLGEQQLETQIYVRVVGRLDAYNNNTELRAIRIRPILDMHEPFLHSLEAMVALMSKQRPSASPLARIAPAAEAPQSPLAQRHSQDIDRPAVSLDAQEPTDAIAREFDELTLVTGTGNSSHGDIIEVESPQISPRSPQQPSSPSSPMSGGGPLATGHRPSLRQDPYSALSPLQRDIILQIQNNDALYPDGVPIRVVFRRTISPRSGVNESEIRQAIDELMDNGLLYATIDLYHFKLVD